MIRITKQNSDYTGILWVLKARSTEESRYHLHYIASKNGELIATDGHRLHIYKPEMIIKDGNYEVITSNKNEIILEGVKEIEFPSWEQVFPKGKPSEEIMIECHSKDMGSAYTRLVRKLPEPNTINLKYFEDLLCICDRVTFSIYGENEPIKLVSGKYRGLIMPIRI
jgi:DNA polymerase III sliding clamp (beta) subunit (PCNA family)